MQGKINEGGKIYDHWSHTTIAFTIITNLVTFKLFLETHYWNTINM